MSNFNVNLNFENRPNYFSQTFGVIRIIGTGATGDVFKVINNSDNNIWAIKKLGKSHI